MLNASHYKHTPASSIIIIVCDHIAPIIDSEYFLLPRRYP